MKTKTPPKYKSGETVIYQGAQYQIVDSYLGSNGYRYDLGTPANRSIAENELALDHKPELDRLYAECDRAFGDEWHKAFDKLSEYVELHNLTLAQISEIRHPTDSTELTRADFALCDLLPY